MCPGGMLTRLDMPVKRESSPSPTPSSEPQTPKKKTKTTAASPRTPKTGKGSGPSTPSTPGSGWTSEKREALVEELLTAGLRSVKAAEIAAKVSSISSGGFREVRA